MTSATTTAPEPIAAAFERDGCYLARGVFDPATVRALEADFDRIVAQLLASGEGCNARWESAARFHAAAEQEVLHTHNVQSFSARWLSALMDPRLLDPVEAILGPDIVLHHSKLFQKPPGIGAPFPMHQDWGYFPTERDRMIAAIIHLTPADEDMGCLRAYPGSHREGRIDSAMGSIGRDNEAGFRSFTQRYPLSGATAFAAEPGDVFFFHYHTVHGSGPNVSDRTRKTVLVQLLSGADEVEAGNGHSHCRLVLRGWNHRATRSAAGAVLG